MTDIPEFDKSGFSIEAIGRRVDKPWGYEVIISPPDAPYCAKLIAVKAGKRLSLQCHDTKVETQTLVSGEGILVTEDADGQLREIDMVPGVGYHVWVGQRHRLIARTDMLVFEASSPEAGITYRLEDDFARPHETEELRARR
jgi:mannose-6-phosphate isomerase-like protein (cupin superfamily)